MELVHPDRLWLLVGVAVVALVARWSHIRRRRDWRELAQAGVPPSDSAYLWLASAACLVGALAQPRWGDTRAQVAAGHDVVLAIDVSRSMGATDAVPDRLGVAVEAAESLIEAIGREPGDRVAIVAFAGRGVLTCPLTQNLGAAIDTLRTFQPGALQPGGTNLAAGLAAAYDAFDVQQREGGRTIVVFSDGEDHPAAWLDVLNRLHSEGVVVHSIVVGDPAEGHPVPRQPRLESEPLIRGGEVVLTRRVDEPLSTIARETGGAFVPLGLASVDLGELYTRRIEPVAKARRTATTKIDRVERFRWWVLPALILSIGANWPRRRGLMRTPIHVLPMLILAIVLVGAEGRPSLTELIDRGREAFAQGRATEALQWFERARALEPGNPVVRYDIAAALFRLERFREARETYESIRSQASPALQVKIDYALGNSALALGDLAEAVRRFDGCLASQARGTDLDRIRADALINRQFALEQASTRSVPKSQGNETRNPNRSRGSQTREDQAVRPEGEGPNGNPSEGTSSPGGESTNDQDANPRQRTGGAGGTGRSAPHAGSPEDQLARALSEIRHDLKARVDEPEPRKLGDDVKDW